MISTKTTLYMDFLIISTKNNTLHGFLMISTTTTLYMEF
jgi:hypothetical protein